MAISAVIMWSIGHNVYPYGKRLCYLCAVIDWLQAISVHRVSISMEVILHFGLHEDTGKHDHLKYWNTSAACSPVMHLLMY